MSTIQSILQELADEDRLVCTNYSSDFPDGVCQCVGCRAHSLLEKLSTESLPPEPTASESSGDVHLRQARDRIAELESELRIKPMLCKYCGAPMEEYVHRCKVIGLQQQLDDERNPNCDGSLAFHLAESNQRENEAREQFRKAAEWNKLTELEIKNLRSLKDGLEEDLAAAHAKALAQEGRHAKAVHLLRQSATLLLGKYDRLSVEIDAFLDATPSPAPVADVPNIPDLEAGEIDGRFPDPVAVGEKDSAGLRGAIVSIIPHLKYIVEWDGEDDRWDDPGYAAAEALAIMSKALRKRGDEPCAKPENQSNTSPVSNPPSEVQPLSTGDSAGPTPTDITTFKVADPSNGQWEIEVVRASVALSLKSELAIAEHKLRQMNAARGVEYNRTVEAERKNKRLLADRERLERELTASESLRREAGWLPIESAPKDGTIILAEVPDHGAPVVVFWDEALAMAHDPVWVVCWDGEHLSSESRRPTRWQHITTPPVAGEGGEG